MKRVFLLLALVLGIASVQAQVPAEVTDVMDKCRAAMTNPNGLEYEMDTKAGIGPLAMKMHFVIAEKGHLNRTVMTMKVMGVDVVTESGFDGTDTWKIERSSKGDTITFTRGDNRKKGKGDLSLDLDKKYNKAKMKLKDGYYEIAFSEPKDKDNEAKSVTIKVQEKNHILREVRSGARGAKVTMTVTKVRVGLKDSYFKINLSEYSNAVVIRN